MLTETSNGPGTAHLLDQCGQAGMFVEHRRSTDGDRGCAVISRIAATAQPALTAGISLPGRAVAVTLHTEPATTLLGIYVPSSDRAPVKISKKKKAFLASTLEAIVGLPEHRRSHLVLAGDYNVISRHHQPRYPVFRAFEYAFLDQLTDLGPTDIHQHLHPGTQVHSWYGRGGNGYRFDYFYIGAAITADTTGCAHLAEVRTGQLTDHDAVPLTVARTVTRRLPITDTDAAATTLF